MSGSSISMVAQEVVSFPAANPFAFKTCALFMRRRGALFMRRRLLLWKPLTPSTSTPTPNLQPLPFPPLKEHSYCCMVAVLDVESPPPSPPQVPLFKQQTCSCVSAAPPSHPQGSARLNPKPACRLTVASLAGFGGPAGAAEGGAGGCDWGAQCWKVHPDESPHRLQGTSTASFRYCTHPLFWDENPSRGHNGAFKLTSFQVVGPGVCHLRGEGREGGG